MSESLKTIHILPGLKNDSHRERANEKEKRLSASDIKS